MLHDISLLNPQVSSPKRAPKRRKKEIDKEKKMILNTKPNREGLVNTHTHTHC